MKDELINGLKALVKDQIRADIFPAKVLSIHATNLTVDVEDLQGNEFYDVRLSATKGQKGLLPIPAADSYVLVERIGGSDTAMCVVMYSQLGALEVEVINTVLKITDSGFNIERNGDSLAEILGALIDAIKLITVTTANGPSGTPINAASFDALKTRVNALLI